MVTEKEFCDAVHLNIHSVRLIAGYKPSEFEKRVSKLVLEKYSPTCTECRNIAEQLKIKPQGQNKESIFKRIGEAINNA